VLSAVAPDKMPLVLQNVRSVLKHGGRVLFRDYAFGDLAQERLMSKGQQISGNFYVRGDGTVSGSPMNIMQGNSVTTIEIQHVY